MKTFQTYYSLRSFVAFASRHTIALVATSLTFLISTITIVIAPLLIGNLVQAASTPNTHDAVMPYVWLLIAASSGHDLLWRVGELLHRRYINPLSYAYETQLFQAVIAKPYPYFVDKFTGKIGSYVASISAEFRGLFADIFYAYIPQVVGIVTTAIIMASVNWQTFVIFILGIVGMFVAGRYTLKLSGKYESIATDIQSTKNGYIFDSIANFASVKSFQKELSEIRLIQRSQAESLAAGQNAYKYAIIFWASMSLFIRHLIWPITILLNVHFFLAGQLSLGQLATFLSTILIFSSTVWDTVAQLSQLGLRFARAEEAHRYLFGDTILAKSTPPYKQPAAVPLKHSLSLKNLTFAYPDQPDTAILKSLSISIKKGEKVGIVGKSGSGKTTLVKLLLGYYDFDKAMLNIDGVPVSPRNIAESIAYVPQDTSLFHRSVADNIAYSTNDKVSRSAVVAAAKKAHAHEFIADIDGGYDALVGERGVKLSGGQRQRIAIARAILKDAPILILDEATSALDSENEQLIQEALWELMKDRTAIVIAHRLSTIQKMDRIIVLDKGRVAEDGTHQELLQNKHIYASLWSHQSGGFIEE